MAANPGDWKEVVVSSTVLYVPVPVRSPSPDTPGGPVLFYPVPMGEKNHKDLSPWVERMRAASPAQRRTALTRYSSVAEVQKVLKHRGYSPFARTKLQFFNGASLMESTEFDLHCRIGSAEGKRLFRDVKEARRSSGVPPMDENAPPVPPGCPDGEALPSPSPPPSEVRSDLSLRSDSDANISTSSWTGRSTSKTRKVPMRLKATKLMSTIIDRAYSHEGAVIEVPPKESSKRSYVVDERRWIVYDYKKSHAGELALRPPHEVHVKRKRDDGWAFGSSRGLGGWFPLCCTVPRQKKYARVPYEPVVPVRKEIGGSNKHVGDILYHLAAHFELDEPGPNRKFLPIKCKVVDRYHQIHYLRMCSPRQLRCVVVFDHNPKDEESKPFLKMEAVLNVLICSGTKIDPTRLIPLPNVRWALTEGGHQIHILADFSPDIDRKVFRSVHMSGSPLTFTIAVDVEFPHVHAPLRFIRVFRVYVREFADTFVPGPPAPIEGEGGMYKALSSVRPGSGAMLYKLWVAKWPLHGKFYPEKLEHQGVGP